MENSNFIKTLSAAAMLALSTPASAEDGPAEKIIHEVSAEVDVQIQSPLQHNLLPEGISNLPIATVNLKLTDVSDLPREDVLFFSTTAEGQAELVGNGVITQDGIQTATHLISNNQLYVYNYAIGFQPLNTENVLNLDQLDVSIFTTSQFDNLPRAIRKTKLSNQELDRQTLTINGAPPNRDQSQLPDGKVTHITISGEVQLVRDYQQNDITNSKTFLGDMFFMRIDKDTFLYSAGLSGSTVRDSRSRLVGNIRSVTSDQDINNPEAMDPNGNYFICIVPS